MVNDIIDIEIMQDVDMKTLPASLQKKSSVKDIIEDNLRDVNELYKSISDSDINISEKINELLRIKTAMLSPMIRLVGNPSIETPEITMYAANVTRLIDNIEQSLYKKAEFELAQEVDFNHPKIQVAFKFIFEAVIDNLSDLLTQDEIDIFTQQFSLTVTGFEDELNTRLKGLSASVLSTLENPLIRRTVKKDD